MKERIKKHKDITDKIEAFGPPKQREDREFRKQSIMTFRTLLLENFLRLFLLDLLNKISIKLSVGTLISLLFKRSGTVIETYTQIIYWLNTAGLSKSYKEKLEEIIEGLNALNLCREGRLIRVRLREAPS